MEEADSSVLGFIQVGFLMVSQNSKGLCIYIYLYKLSFTISIIIVIIIISVHDSYIHIVYRS